MMSFMLLTTKEMYSRLITIFFLLLQIINIIRKIKDATVENKEITKMKLSDNKNFILLPIEFYDFHLN